VPAELIAGLEDRDLQRVQRVGTAVQLAFAQYRGDERGQVTGGVQPPDRRGPEDLVEGDGLLAERAACVVTTVP
jgi:hypothetical protein